MLGLKKCFHCAHCRYSTDRKNNLKRHLGTMHRDHYVAGVMQLDQTKYHVSVVHRRQSPIGIGTRHSRRASQRS